MSTDVAAREKGPGRGTREPAPLERMLALGEVPLFHKLGRRHLRRVERLVETRRYWDEPVVQAGAVGDSFHIILEGRASVHTVQGHELTIHPGDFFGELALLDGAPRDATVSALGELTTACIERRAFFRLLLNEPGIAEDLARGLVAIVRDLQEPEDPPNEQIRLARLLDSLSGAGGKTIEGSTSLGWLSSLERVPLFQELNSRHLTRVIRLAQLRRYPTGTVVVRIGARGDSFHIVLDGRARVATSVAQELPDQPLLGAGDFFGELALLDGAPRAASIVAVDDLTTARIARPAFIELMRAEPSIAAAVLRSVVGIIRVMESTGQPAQAAH